MYLSELLRELQAIQSACGSVDPEVRVGARGGEEASALAAGVFPIDSVHDRKNWPGGSVVIGIAVATEAARQEPLALLLYAALREARAVVRQHNLLSTAAEGDCRATIWRLLDWWNRVAVPTMELAEWACEFGPDVPPDAARTDGGK